MRSNPTAVIVAVFIAEMAVAFESAMIFSALPMLIRQYGDPVMAGWLVTVHLLVSAASYAIAGRLGDIRGRKTVMLCLLAVAACGSTLSAVTGSFAMVLAGRALQGVGSAVLPLSIGVLRENLPNERIPVAVGLMTTASGAGVVLGLILGGAIIDNFNWHWLFAVSALLLVIAFFAVRLLVPTRPGTPPRQPIDWVEGLLPAPAIMLVLLGISLSKDLGWLDTRVEVLVVAGACVFAYWARRALASAEPFIDLRLFANRDVLASNVLAVLMALGTANNVLVFSAYVQSPAWTAVGLGLSATMYGLVKLPSNFMSFFAGPISGWLMQRRGSRVPVILSGLLAGTGWIVAMLMPDHWLKVMLLLCWISFGTSALYAVIPNIIVAAVPAERTSEAIGTMAVVRGMFAAIGAQILAVILATGTVLSPDGKSHFPSATGYLNAMIWIAATTLVATACGFLLSARRREAHAAQVRG